MKGLWARGMESRKVEMWQSFGLEVGVWLGVDGFGDGNGEVGGVSCLGRRGAGMKRQGFVLMRAGQHRHRLAGFDSFPLRALGPPILSGCLMVRRENQGRQ